MTSTLTQDLDGKTGMTQESMLKIPTRDMTEENPISRAWDIIEKARVGMLTTQFSGGLRARPLEARADRDAGMIWFVTDVRGAKDDEIDAAHDIGLVFIDKGDRAYLSITGRAFVTRDPAKTKEIWKKTDDIWLPGGPDDPNVRLLRIEPITAELWDGPSSGTIAVFEFAKQ
ncbi:MAG: pyridoxamine 5'-phosphate oxidase family protein [Gammaproteobacteria bacterium]